MNENPYRAPETESLEPVSGNRARRSYAGFGSRFLAQIIDGIILYAISIATTIAFGGDPFNIEEEVNPMQPVVNLVVGIGFCVFFWNTKGATPGKMALGIKVVDAQGNFPSIGSCLFRYVGYIISAIPLLLGYLWMAWDRESQTWHDKIAGTYVVSSSSSRRRRR